MIWLVLAYPLLTHAAVWLREPRLQWPALTALVAVALFDALKKSRTWAWVTLVVVSGALFLIVNFGGGLYVLYIPPILLPAALLTLFARSLRRDSVALITRFAADAEYDAGRAAARVGFLYARCHRRLGGDIGGTDGVGIVGSTLRIPPDLVVAHERRSLRDHGTAFSRRVRSASIEISRTRSPRFHRLHSATDRHSHPYCLNDHATSTAWLRGP